MDKIFFKFNGGRKGDFHNSPEGWIALDHYSQLEDRTMLLSAGCVSIREIEGQAQMLKRLIDNAVRDARKKLPQ